MISVVGRVQNGGGQIVYGETVKLFQKLKCDNKCYYLSKAFWHIADSHLFRLWYRDNIVPQKGSKSDSGVATVPIRTKLTPEKPQVYFQGLLGVTSSCFLFGEHLCVSTLDLLWVYLVFTLSLLAICLWGTL